MIMANYTETLAQMYRLVLGQEKNQIGSGNTSAGYVETAKEVIKLERQLIKASNKNVSPMLYPKAVRKEKA